MLTQSIGLLHFGTSLREAAARRENVQKLQADCVTPQGSGWRVFPWSILLGTTSRFSLGFEAPRIRNLLPAGTTAAFASAAKAAPANRWLVPVHRSNMGQVMGRRLF